MTLHSSFVIPHIQVVSAYYFKEEEKRKTRTITSGIGINSSKLENEDLR